MVHAGDVGRPDACGRAAQAAPPRVAQLEHALAAEEHDAAPASERSRLARGTGGRRQLADAGRPAAGESGGDEHDRDRTEREASA
jgi:hypothetical protein